VRPEHLAPAADGPLEVQVRAVEWLGHECLVFADVGGTPIVVREQGMAPNEAGNQLRVTAQPTDVHLFDPETTARLS
jgi:ABC-type sugar transport system ATPase subunit